MTPLKTNCEPWDTSTNPTVPSALSTPALEQRTSVILSLLCLLGIWAIFFYPLLFQDYVFYFHDIRNFYYPYRFFCAQQWRQGILPLFSALSSCGFPVHASAELGVFYPLNIILYSLFAPLTAYTVSILLHFLLAALGMFGLQKVRRRSSTTALISAVTFACSGFMVTHVQHNSILSASAWLPLIFLCLHQAVRGWRLTWLVAAVLCLSMQFLASHPQIAVISSFSAVLYILWHFKRGPEFTHCRRANRSGRSRGFNGANEAKPGHRSWKQDPSTPPPSRSRDLAVVPITFALLLIVLTYSLSAVQLLPTFETVQYSGRGDKITAAFRNQGAVQPQMLITLIFPHFFGLVHPWEVAGYGFVHPNYWGQGGAFWELCGYMGILSLLAIGWVLLSPELRRSSAFFLCLAALALIMSLGDKGGLYRLFAFFPGAARLRFPSRFLLLWSFASALLAGEGMSLLFSLRKHRALAATLRRNTALFVLLLFCLLGAVHLLLRTNHQRLEQWGEAAIVHKMTTQKEHRLPYNRYVRKWRRALDEATIRTSPWYPETNRQLLLISACLGLLYLASAPIPGRSRRIAITSLLFLLWGVDLFRFGVTYNLPTPRAGAKEKPRVLSQLQANESTQPFRILSLERKSELEREVLKPSSNVLFNVASLFTPGPLMDHRLHRWLRQTGCGIFPFELEAKWKMLLNSRPLIDLLNIRFIITQRNLSSADGFAELMHTPVHLYRNLDSLPRCTLVHKTRLVSASLWEELPAWIVNNRIDVRSTAIVMDPAATLPHRSVAETRATEDEKIEVTTYNHHTVTVSVHATAPGLLRIADIFYPGWQALRDGEKVPLFQCDGLFKAVKVPAGTHEISITYHPFSTRLGLFMSLLTLAVISGLLVRHPQRCVQAEEV